MDWKWLWASSDQRLLKCVQQGWEIWIPVQSHRYHGRKFKCTSTVLSEIPADMHLARVEEDMAMVIFHGTHSFKLEQQTFGTKVDFYTFICTDAAASWAFQSLLAPDNGKAIVQAILLGKCMAVSDGSFQEELGTMAWIFF